MEWNSGSIHACQIWGADQYMLIVCFVLNHLCIFCTLIIYKQSTNFLALLLFPSPLQPVILRVLRVLLWHLILGSVFSDIVSDLPVHQRYWFRRHAARHWATARFLWRQPKPETLCLSMSGTRLHCSPSVANLKLCCLGCCTLISCHVTDYINIVRWSCSSGSNATLPPNSC